MVGYLVFLTIFAGLYALSALGLNLQWGYAGLINFGHVAFMTVGAYTTVLLGAKGVPIIIAIVAGIAIAVLLGLLIGMSTLRLREDYLAIVTIGVSELLRLIALNEEWLTEGSFGVRGFPLPLESFDPNLVEKYILIGILTLLAIYGAWQLWRGLRSRRVAFGSSRSRGEEIQGKSYQPTTRVDLIFWGLIGMIVILTVYINGCLALLNYNYKAGLMLLILIALAVTYWGLELLANSPWGRVLKAIREDEEIATALGKNVFWYKLQAFMLGGAIAGLAGAFYAWQLTTIYPRNFETLITFNIWTMVVLGGAGKNSGALLGTIIFWAYDALTRFYLPKLGWFDSSEEGAFRVMVIGLILMILMVWRPQGILGKKEELTLGR